MQIETNISLKPYNTFGLPAVARTLIRIHSEEGLRQLSAHPEYGKAPKFVLGGGSNIVLTRDMHEIVLKIEIMGQRLIGEKKEAWIVEAGAGEAWHGVVEWTLRNGWPGLENLALIPGTAGAAPIQNIGAYGVELKDRFDSLDAVDLTTGRLLSLDGPACAFGYRDSIFKHALAGRCVITRVRLRLPKLWQPMLAYPDVQNKYLENGAAAPRAEQVFDWVCGLRNAKLPDPKHLGNAGSFFKNPVVSRETYSKIMNRHTDIVSFPMTDGNVKISAGRLIEACGWMGKTLGHAGVYDKQALVLVNHGCATGQEVAALARAIQESVRRRFGIVLEMEPILL